MKTQTAFFYGRQRSKQRSGLSILFATFVIFCSNSFGQKVSNKPAVIQNEIADVSDPSAIKLKTSDQGIVVCGTLHDCIANYPQLKDGLIAETTKKLEAEDEIAAQHRMQILNGQKIDIPKATLDKHNARIGKFAKAKEDALVKVAKTNPSRAKAKQAELIAAGIPISDATKKAVEAAQPRPTPTAAPVASATPNDGL